MLKSISTGGLLFALIVFSSVTFISRFFLSTHDPKGFQVAHPNPFVIAVADPAVPGTPIAPDPNALMVQPVPAPVDPPAPDVPVAAGWPVALAGRVFGSPAVADVEGNGHLCVIVPVVAFTADTGLVHPHPSNYPLLYALRADGTSVPGWPIRISERSAGKKYSGPWASSPSVFHDQAGDHIAVVPYRGGIEIINPDHSIDRPQGRVDAASSPPLVDLHHDGKWVTICGSVASTVDEKPIPGWPASRRFRNGYAPAIGDALGDGNEIIVHLFYTAHDGHCPLAAYDSTGQRLEGWPQMISDASWFSPVMGHITDDPGMQVVGAYGSHIFAWTIDGKPLACDTTDGDYTGVFKNNVDAQTATPTLADLDGDGKAEIIVYDHSMGGIRAWHGDGKPIRAVAAAKPQGTSWAGLLGIGRSSVPVNSDDGSLIAKLPGDANGVSVVSLGDDPKIMDFFAGTSWVRLQARWFFNRCRNVSWWQQGNLLDPAHRL